jgi:hypothetical protein
MNSWAGVSYSRCARVSGSQKWRPFGSICIAPNYKKYDLHAVQVMAANIELWTHRLFQNSTLYLEEVFQKTYARTAGTSTNAKNPVMVAEAKRPRSPARPQPIPSSSTSKLL